MARPKKPEGSMQNYGFRLPSDDVNQLRQIAKIEGIKHTELTRKAVQKFIQDRSN